VGVLKIFFGNRNRLNWHGQNAFVFCFLTVFSFSAIALTPLTEIHPAYQLIDLRPNGFYPGVMGIDFFSNGKMALLHYGGLKKYSESRQFAGKLYIIDGVTGDSPHLTYTLAVDSLEDPAGMTIVDDEVYISGGNKLLKLVDSDNDQIIEEKQVIYSDDEPHGRHSFYFGLIHHEGKLYGHFSSELPKKDTINPDLRGTFTSVDIATGKIDFISAGFRMPMGLVRAPDGAWFGTEVQGEWQIQNKINHLQRDQFYGFRNNIPRTAGTTDWGSLPYTPPTIHLPEGELANTPGSPIFLKTGPYKGHMIYADESFGGINRVFMEKVNGQYQGAAFLFSGGFDIDLCILKYGPDNMIYIGGVGWEEELAMHESYGLQKIKLSGNTAFEMYAVRIKPDGFEIEFTEPASVTAADPNMYIVKAWSYGNATKWYGGAKKNRQDLVVKSVKLSGDGKKVHLEIPVVNAGGVVHFTLGALKSVTGKDLWTNKAWYSANRLGEGVDAYPPEIMNTALKDKSVAKPQKRVRFYISQNQMYVPFNEPWIIRVLDMNGRSLQTFSGSKSGYTAFPGSEFKSGVYLFEIKVNGKRNKMLMVPILHN